MRSIFLFLCLFGALQAQSIELRVRVVGGTLEEGQGAVLRFAEAVEPLASLQVDGEGFRAGLEGTGPIEVRFEAGRYTAEDGSERVLSAERPLAAVAVVGETGRVTVEVSALSTISAFAARKIALLENPNAAVQGFTAEVVEQANRYYHDWMCHDLVRESLERLPEDAALFLSGTGDWVLWSLLYYQRVEGLRTDVSAYDQYGMALDNIFAIDPLGERHIDGVPAEVARQRAGLAERLQALAATLGKPAVSIFDLREHLYPHEIDALRIWKQDLLVLSGRPCFAAERMDLGTLPGDWALAWQRIFPAIVPAAEHDPDAPWLALPIRGLTVRPEEPTTLCPPGSVERPFPPGHRASSYVYCYYLERRAFHAYDRGAMDLARTLFETVTDVMPTTSNQFNIGVARAAQLAEAVAGGADSATIATLRADVSEAFSGVLLIAANAPAYPWMPAEEPRTLWLTAIDQLGSHGLVSAPDPAPVCRFVIRVIERLLERAEPDFEAYRKEQLERTGRHATHPVESGLRERLQGWKEHDAVD